MKNQSFTLFLTFQFKHVNTAAAVAAAATVAAAAAVAAAAVAAAVVAADVFAVATQVHFKLAPRHSA